MGYDEFRADDARRFVENVEYELRGLRPGEPVPGLDRIEGADASATVYAVVGPSGDLVRIDVTDAWWSAVGAHGIASAVLQAWRYARDKSSLARLVMMRHGLPLPEVRAPDAVPDPEPFPQEPSAWVAEAERRADRTYAAIERIDRRLALLDSHEPYDVSGPAGIYHVRKQGVTIVGAWVNEAGLRPDHGPEIAEDARAALIAATNREWS